MELQEVLKARRMVRRFLPQRVPAEVLARITQAALRAPSAGHTQAAELVVIEDAERLDVFWDLADPRGRKRTEHPPPAVVVVATDRNAYLERYASADKAGLGLDDPDRWSVPFWFVDAGMSVMAMLLAAVDEGLGGWFFGVFTGRTELASELGLPAGLEIVGAVALGYAHPDDVVVGSAATRSRRAPEERIHATRWGTPGI